jgi:unsaturated rhamnogalacturonyl hydrolase
VRRRSALPLALCLLSFVGCGAETDWSVEVVETTMRRYGDALPGWSYPVGLYLFGQHLVYQRTGDPRHLEYIREWAERFVDADGEIDRDFDSLDDMMAGRVLNLLHAETGDQRFYRAAKKIRDRLDTYPRTSDGGFWHSVRQEHQLWSDGTFMINPFLVEYGRQFGDEAYAFDEATKQLVVYADHLQQPDGILRHAYDEKRVQEWANLETGVAPESWCRAIGWYGVAAIHILEIVPDDHPRRGQVLRILRDLVAGLAEHQDPATGLWFEVVDRGDRADNWTETSCSSMYTFTISRGVELGWLDEKYAEVAERGYEGVLSRISLADGVAVLTDVVVGTNVGDYRYYIDRPRANNDLHGLGAFLIMNEQLRRTRGE